MSKGSLGTANICQDVSLNLNLVGNNFSVKLLIYLFFIFIFVFIFTGKTFEIL